jgi:acyl-ACP thioesterase
VSSSAQEDFAPPTPGGRVYTQTMRPGLADCAPSGRMRLDAIARWCQDIAYADVADAGLADRAFWILRRTRIRVRRFPAINEPRLVQTFCSGVGRLVAERRTVIGPAEDPGRHDVDAVSLWVHLDPVSRRPSNLTAAELATYTTAASRQRRVSHRLRHRHPAPDGCRLLFDWCFRRVDTDMAEHVNNAAYWELLEEELLSAGSPGGEPDRGLDAELEFRDGAQPGPVRYLGAGERLRMIVDPGDGLLATLTLTRPDADSQAHAPAGGADRTSEPA